jgi:hypothetical protein
MGISTPEQSWFILGGVARPRDLIGYFSSSCWGALGIEGGNGHVENGSECNP